MSKNLTILARIKVKQDKVQFMKDELEKLIVPTRNEEGCVQYDLHQDNYDPSLFVFFENWATRELWQLHMDSDHILAYLKATDGAVESFDVNELTLV